MSTPSIGVGGGPPEELDDELEELDDDVPDELDDDELAEEADEDEEDAEEPDELAEDDDELAEDDDEPLVASGPAPPESSLPQAERARPIAAVLGKRSLRTRRKAIGRS